MARFFSLALSAVASVTATDFEPFGFQYGVDKDPQIKPKETFPEYVGKYGIKAEEHWITTEDGYILKAFRLPNPGAPVIYIQHALLTSSWHAVINEPHLSPGLVLWNMGYDIWLPNNRGNTYSFNHTTLHPSYNKEFWDFTWSEMGHYDVPANIKYILENTGKENLSYIGWSQGTTQMMIASQDDKLKDYIAKTVNVAMLLAPVAYMEHQFSPVFELLTKFYIDYWFYNTFDPWGFLNAHSTPALTQLACDLLGGGPCSIVIDLFFGVSPLDNVKATQNMTAHFPAGCSMKDLIHYAQTIRSGGFKEFDYGAEGNVKKYGQSEPPSFDMSKVSVPTALFIGERDMLGDAKDNERLVAEYNKTSLIHHKVYEKFSHVSFFLGYQEAFNMWFPDMQNILRKYNPLPEAIV